MLGSSWPAAAYAESLSKCIGTSGGYLCMCADKDHPTMTASINDHIAPSLILQLVSDSFGKLLDSHSRADVHATVDLRHVLAESMLSCAPWSCQVTAEQNPCGWQKAKQTMGRCGSAQINRRCRVWLSKVAWWHNMLQ